MQRDDGHALPAHVRAEFLLETTRSVQRLVRDGIPDAIESRGNLAVWRALADEPYEYALYDTIVRSSQQFSSFHSMDALADLFESIDAWLALKGLERIDVDQAREQKRKRCGSYDKRLFLEQVAPGGGIEKARLHPGTC